MPNDNTQSLISAEQASKMTDAEISRAIGDLSPLGQPHIIKEVQMRLCLAGLREISHREEIDKLLISMEFMSTTDPHARKAANEKFSERYSK